MDTHKENNKVFVNPFDIIQISPYFSTDLEKQQATNIFLGVFIPKEGKQNIWELPTDYYLHNKDLAGLRHISRNR